MTVSGVSIQSGAYSTLIPTGSTMMRDVSDLLDLWAHKDTPFLNRIKWAGASGGLSREWLSEHLGFGYITTGTSIDASDTSFIGSSSDTGLDNAEVAKQVQAGSLLYVKNTADSLGSWCTVATVGASASFTISWLATCSTTIAAGSKFYVVAHFVNEGSSPFADTSRKRNLLSNIFNILRKDIKITGSQANTDMYAVANDPTHQMAMRLLEMQFERERSILLASTKDRAASTIGQMDGALGYLDAYTSKSWVDNSTTTLTESTFNDLVAACWENGGTPDVFVGNVKQMRLFTDWDDSKIRTRVDARMGGHWITSYLCDTGIEIDLLPMRHFPVNLGFVLDTSLMSLVPKKNRKLIVEKLAKVGDFDRWQLLSEYTLEMRKYDQGAHGAFIVLA